MIDNAISGSLLQNFLGLFTEKGEVDVDATSKFLDISRAELAKAFGLSADCIRPDRIGAKTKERIKELACALEFVAETFDGDREKTLFWFNTGNPNFGGADPKTLIIRGRYHKVLKFIFAAKIGVPPGGLPLPNLSSERCDAV